MANMPTLTYSTCLCATKTVKVDILEISVGIRMIRVCKSCGKEFQSFNEGVIYSSVVRGILDFCSDKCSKDYLNAVMK